VKLYSREQQFIALKEQEQQAVWLSQEAALKANVK
jgi:hypothetical protein